MNAHDRFLPDWFSRIKTRQITLPRFQRFTAWGHGEVAGLLTTVLRGLPSGATLILQVGDHEKFISRTLIDAPETGEKVTEQLLDGQQRLTALWRSLNNKYPDRIYLIGYEEDPEDADKKLPYVFSQARWYKKGQVYPMWVDDPKECKNRGFIPIYLLRPDDSMAEIRKWASLAVDGDLSQKELLEDDIIALRDKVREFNLPYLALPATTPKDVALDVFIKMNTSSVRLSTYDIVVALVEEETGKSLHDHVDDLDKAVPRAKDYADLPSLVLDVVALKQDRIPSQAGYQGIDFTRMIEDWEVLVRSIRGMITFLEDECIFDAQRLPSYTAIPIIAAIWDLLPTHPDKLGNARLLLRRFLWRAFLTSRYEQSSTSNALQDYRGLKKIILDGSPENAAPIFNVDLYPLPGKDLILQADWPKRKTILGRGLLSLQLKCGAEDLADGAKATVATITSPEHPREYHHLFPDANLREADIPDERIFCALNCALITWKTNRTISNKDPITYLKERADNCLLGDDELKRRLKTHLIPLEQLSVGYNGISDDERRNRIGADFERFLNARADLLIRASQLVCEGRPFTYHDVIAD